MQEHLAPDGAGTLGRYAWRHAYDALGNRTDSRMPGGRHVQWQAAGIGASAAKGGGASPASSIQPIDPDRAAKAFRRGKFLSESTETGADGKPSRETETMCMDETNASFLPMAALMGVAGCEPQATREDKLSFSVQASCPRDTKFGPNAYEATLRWSADGKQITLQSTRRALVDGKASDKVVQSLRYQLTWQAARCD
ncbi:hypothetical protein C8245_13285 [Paracidovorax avenae]|uniref:hypothetical protein n=1 Tax=Paracidovorax avenae TaxID=80867 RepID=UPI000D223DB4|nr:hypothetical protein [Paracidovorax avenae]AVS66518.1 hypothetical protein C8245_13285 [Paracidovorax avenae]